MIGQVNSTIGAQGVDQVLVGLETAGSGLKQAADGADTLAAGIDTAKTGADQLDSGATELADNMVTARDGSAQLAAGADQLATAIDGVTGPLLTALDGGVRWRTSAPRPPSFGNRLLRWRVECRHRSRPMQVPRYSR